MVIVASVIHGDPADLPWWRIMDIWSTRQMVVAWENGRGKLPSFDPDAAPTPDDLRQQAIEANMAALAEHGKGANPFG